MPDEVKVEGGARLNASLRQLSQDLEDLAPPQAASLVGAEASRRAPKRSGRLAASFRSDTADGVVRMGFGTAYAAPVHWGVGPRPGLRGPHNIRRNPFLWGAVEDLQRRWMATYEKAAQAACDRVKGA